MKNIPDFLIEMSREMNTQDNRITAHPVFEVRYKKGVITDSRYGYDHIEIVDLDPDLSESVSIYSSKTDENYSKLGKYLLENYEDLCVDYCKFYGIDFNKNKFPADFDKEFNLDQVYEPYNGFELPADIDILYINEEEITVNTHFTEKDAQAFIDRKQHDYPPLYIYVSSLFYCESMIKLQNWIKSLTSEEL